MAISDNLTDFELEYLKFRKSKGDNSQQAFGRLLQRRKEGKFGEDRIEFGDLEKARGVGPKETPIKSFLEGGGKLELATPEEQRLPLAPIQPGKIQEVAKTQEESRLGTFGKIGRKLENPLSEAITSFGREVQEASSKRIVQATGKEIPFTEESKIKQNFQASFEKVVGAIAETLGSPIESATNLGATLKAVFKKGLENDPIIGRFIQSTEGDKAIQEALTEAGQGVIQKVIQQGLGTTINEAIQEDPVLALTIITSIFKKLGRAGEISTSTQKKIDKLTSEAETNVEQFLKPTKEKTKEQVVRIKGEVVEKGITGTREQVKELSKAKVQEFSDKIDDFVASDKFKGEVPISDLTKVLDEMEDLLIEPKSGLVLPGEQANFRFIVDTRQFLEDIAKKTGNTLSPDQSLFLKRSFSKVFAGNLTSLEKFQNNVNAKLGTKLKDELARDNPDLDVLNKEFSFWLNLDQVLKQTIKRTQGQAEGGGLETKASSLTQRIGTGVGGSIGVGVGFAVGGPTGVIILGSIGTVLGAKLARKLDIVASSPKYKLISAQKKKQLAEAIALQDAGTVEKLLDGIIVSQGISELDNE